MPDLGHKACGAPPPGYAGPRRSLILAGGGIRVSYQAGVVRALLESELYFFHVDGTSGGGVNLAMLLSGLSPVEMCERWRTLSIRDFVSFLPIQDYLKTYDRLAFGDGDGIKHKVFPHLGIDVEKINTTQGIEATFNVFNYTRKINEVITHNNIDADLILAGMSLPMVLPPVQKGDTLYLDSAFVRDANLMEAVRRGAEELWVVWILGNTDEYRGGMLNLYVQMLEMSAVGALHDEFEQIAEINARIRQGDKVYGHTSPIRLHLIKPEYPLPLDPDLFLGRVDAATLINMGYADAKKYLESMSEEGVPFSPETTKMRRSGLGVTFRETMAGGFSLGETDPQAGEEKGRAEDTVLSMHATVNVHDLQRFVSDPDYEEEIVARLEFAPFGPDIPAKRGVFNLFSPTDNPMLKLMVYELSFEHNGQDYYLAGRKEVHDGAGLDIWKDTTTLLAVLHEGKDKTGPVVGAGILSLSPSELFKMALTIHSTGAKSLAEEVRAVAEFGRFFVGELWDSYLARPSRPDPWWRRWMWWRKGRAELPIQLD